MLFDRIDFKPNDVTRDISGSELQPTRCKNVEPVEWVLVPRKAMRKAKVCFNVTTVYSTRREKL